MLWLSPWRWCQSIGNVYNARESQIAFNSIEYSAISGVVATVSIGTPPQQVRVGIDFSLGSSIIYGSGTCPPFVEACYNAAASTTYLQAGPKPTQVLTEYATTLCHTSRDEVNKQEMVFELASAVAPLTARFRDVAGVIGLSRSSVGMSQKMFAVSDDSIIEVFGQTIDFHRLVTVPAERDSAGWVVEGICRLDGIALHSSRRVLYDPGEHDFLIPFTDWKLLSRSVASLRGELNSEGRLWIFCKAMPPGIAIKFRSFPIRDFNISPEQLWLPLRLEDTMDGRCATRIVFRHGIETLIIGRLLTRKMGRVILNNRDTTLHLPLKRPWPDSNSFESPPAFVPMFYTDWAQFSKNLMVFDAIENRFELIGGLVLETFTSRFVQFLRTSPESDRLRGQQLICGESIETMISRDQIVVTCPPGKTHRVRFKLFPMMAALRVTTNRHRRHVRFANDKHARGEKP